MSLNTAHANNGVLIHAGEAILLFSENVTMEFSGQDNNLFKGTKQGKIYLTTHRMIYNAKSSGDPMQSFSFPFICLTDVELEQPVFGANYIKGKVRSQENGNFVGEAKFKLLFKSGGAIDFAQAMLRAAHMAKQNSGGAAPPPYSPPTGTWFEAPPPAYSPNPTGYYGWLPNTQAFPNQPPPNSVFMYDQPPPYPGIVPPGPQTANGYPGYAPAPGYPQPGQQPGYPQPGQLPGYPQPGQQPGYAQPGQQPGYPQPGQQPGYPPTNQLGYPQPGGYPPAGGYQQPGYPQPSTGAGGWANPSYNPAGSSGSHTMGFSGPPNSKETEANQQYAPPQPQPQQPYQPPPGYYDQPPPSYSSLNQNQKKDQ